MSARLYNKGKENLLIGNIDMLNNDIVVMLISAEYLPNTAVHSTRADISSSAIIAQATLTSTQVASGVFDADDVTFATVTGETITQIVIAQDDRIDSRALLIALIDDADFLPVVPDGENITIQWDNSTNKIFKL